MRERKPETIIRELKSDLKRCQAERLGYHDEAYAQRNRAGRAEAELAEWKRRFDSLMLLLLEDVRDKAAGKPGIFDRPRGDDGRG